MGSCQSNSEVGVNTKIDPGDYNEFRRLMDLEKELCFKEMKEANPGNVVGSLISSKDEIFDKADEDEDGKLNKNEWFAHYKQFINKQSFINGIDAVFDEDRAEEFYTFLSGLSNRRFAHKGITKSDM